LPFAASGLFAGKLSVMYLGSQPPKQSMSFANSRQVDYAAMEQERRALLAMQAAGQQASRQPQQPRQQEGQLPQQVPLVTWWSRHKCPADWMMWIRFWEKGALRMRFSAQASNAAAVKQSDHAPLLFLHNMSAAALQVGDGNCSQDSCCG